MLPVILSRTKHIQNTHTHTHITSHRPHGNGGFVHYIYVCMHCVSASMDMHLQPISQPWQMPAHYLNLNTV